MSNFEYLIIGGGMTAAAAAKLDRPYDRAPLSKDLWKGGSLEGAWRDIEGAGVELMLGNPARGRLMRILDAE